MHEEVKKLREIATKLKGVKIIVPFSMDDESTIIPEGEYDAYELIYFIADMLG